MLIFASLLIPCVTALVLWFWFRHKTTWWEFVIPFAVSAILSTACYFASTTFSASRKEYWTGWITAAAYFEDWNEEVWYTETYYCGSDSKGNPQYCTRLTSRIDYHGPYWEAYGSNGERYDISQGEYKEFASRWANENFKELNRGYYSDDGDEYYTSYNSDPLLMEVIHSVHRYENRVACSKSVFNFRDVSDPQKKELGIVEYPKVVNRWESQCVLGYQPSGWPTADWKMQIFNAQHGALNELKVYIVVFKNQTLDAGFVQQQYWKNGNMNEYVMCIGIDDTEKVMWGHAFSWCDDSTINVMGRNYIDSLRGKPLNLSSVVGWVEKEVPGRWKRKDFEKDFGYISVTPPFWMILVTYLLVASTNIGLSWWIVNNEFEEYNGYN